MPVLHAFAPAKLNLTLHITGRRADGYHDLDSLVTFATIGDTVTLEPADSFTFVLDGPQAVHLRDEPADNNLIVKAATSLAEKIGKPLNVRLTLTKHLPVASGIGGGSSDAAAALRLLAQHWGLRADDPRVIAAAVAYGQDVPVCLRIVNSTITAEGTAPAPDLPRRSLPHRMPAHFSPRRLCGLSTKKSSPASKQPASPCFKTECASESSGNFPWPRPSSSADCEVGT